MKTFLVVLTVILMVLSLSACETMKGLGKNVESAGEWVQKKAD